MLILKNGGTIMNCVDPHRLTSMEIRITQTNDGGIFSGPHSNDFEYTYAGTTYRVRIDQGIKRCIRIGTNQIVDISELLEMEKFIEQFIYLFDGRFYPIEHMEIIDSKEDPTIYKKHVDDYLNRRLSIYNSIELTRYSFMKLINFEDINFEEILLKWCSVDHELDIAYPMFLYCLSDIPMPIDCKIASIIEIAKPLSEIVETNNSSFSLERNKKGQIELKSALKSIIDYYGAPIFKKEMSNDYDTFLQKLVNTRNKISHVRSFRNKQCLDGVECAFYLAKLSIMYREIIYSVLGIDKNLYMNAIIDAISHWDNWYFNNPTS